MLARLPLLVALRALFLAAACAADPPLPAAPVRPTDLAPEPRPRPKPKKSAAERQRDFMGGCARRAASSADYCACAWAEFRREFTEEDMNAAEVDRAKVDHVKSRVLSTCATFVSEEMVRADFAKTCMASKADLVPYCDCTWTELRKTFSAAELNDETTASSERFKTRQSAATKTCGNKLPESLSQEAFLKTCTKDPADAQYCGCAWNELRKRASPSEIEAGTFDQKTLFWQFEKTCGKLRMPRTAP